MCAVKRNIKTTISQFNSRNKMTNIIDKNPAENETETNTNATQSPANNELDVQPVADEPGKMEVAAPVVEKTEPGINDTDLSAVNTEPTAPAVAPAIDQEIKTDPPQPETTIDPDAPIPNIIPPVPSYESFFVVPKNPLDLEDDKPETVIEQPAAAPAPQPNTEATTADAPADAPVERDINESIDAIRELARSIMQPPVEQKKRGVNPWMIGLLIALVIAAFCTFMLILNDRKKAA
jgi:hypothetical protein